MKPTVHFLLLPLLTLCAPVRADEQIPAFQGLDRLRERFGPGSMVHVFEMTGVGGDPQPSTWRLTAHDPARTNALHEYWIGERRVTDEGLNDDYYPNHLPKGFFKLSRVKLDSTQAFAIVEQVARDAGSGFDSVNYKLHGREYSNEPVWTLTLLDGEEEIVGSVHLSADTGDVLRTVWMRRTRSGRLVVEDSALTGESKHLASLAPGTKKNESEPAPPEPEPAPPDPADPIADTPPPAATPPAADKPAEDEEIPEIKRLDEAQEKAAQLPPKKP